jgi:UDP-GlcNAc:undecaprenyl-phosphate GlcNAc-1-phosphate transferase
MRAVARWRKLIVPPDAERVHTVPTPTAGGTAMFLGLVIAFVVARFLPVPEFHLVFSPSREALGVLGAAAVMWLVGFIDDVHEVSPPAKVAGQVIAAMVLYFAGVTLLEVKLPFYHYIQLSSSLLPLVTALWVIGIANAINLIDGLDGLAAGVVAIGAAALCVYGLKLESQGDLLSPDVGPLVAAATCGLCIGFLPHNFHPAKIFMGDTGAMLLGLLMAASTMTIGGQSVDVWGKAYFFFIPLLVPVLILAVPILDVAFAIVRRTVKRTGVAVRDLEHLHHRLIRLGHGHRRAVLILWAWTFVLSAIVLYGSFYSGLRSEILIGIAVLAVGLYTLFVPGRRRAEQAATGVAVAGSVEGEEGLGQAELAAQGVDDGASGASRETPGSPAETAAEAAHRPPRGRRFARHQPGTRG